MGFEYFLPVNNLPLFEKKEKAILEKLCSKGEKIAQIPSLFADPKHEEPSWAIELAQQLIVKSLLPEDPSLVLNTHARQLATSCSSSCRGSNVSGLHGHPYACKEPHVHTIKNKSRKSLLHFAFHKTAIKIHEL